MSNDDVPAPSGSPSPGARLWRWVLGKPRSLQDPSTFHEISLVALLAWVGLGADGLSSSAYGPEEAYRALGQHTYLAVALAAAIAFTVFIIAFSYSKIIEHFPFGGGGYVVATKLLGPRVGLVSGSALLVDYVLTIAVSIASAADQFFSVMPDGWRSLKLPFTFALLIVLMVLNLRGVKESVTALAPIFMGFVVTHVVLLVGMLFTHGGDLGGRVHEVSSGFKQGASTLGLVGLATLFVRAYSMGAGTFTGIEAVSNGLQIMREPKVHTAKRTMVYMAVSLALTAGGIMLGYLLVHAHAEPNKTLNAVLAEAVAGRWGSFGHVYVVLTLVFESALLLVAAQAGFIDGPRVMSNMANDSWLPHRFGQLSDRLVTQDGVVIISAASAVTLLYTHGDTSTLVLMYSINVFVTFSLSQLAMVRYWLQRRKSGNWLRPISIHAIGLLLCVSILAVSIVEKFGEGGWVTLLVTSALVALCLLIRRHYAAVRDNLARLDDVLEALPPSGGAPPEARLPDPKAPVAVLLVGGYGGLGVHALLTVQRIFRGHYKNFVFMSIGVVDAASMKGHEEVERIQKAAETSVEQYVQLARRLGFGATGRIAVGTEVVQEAERLCVQVAAEYPNAVFFAGKLVFQKEGWFQRLLHNETALQVQRRLQFAGLNAMVLPVRVLAEQSRVAQAA